jgi:hypothetical protein
VVEPKALLSAELLGRLAQTLTLPPSSPQDR